MARCAQLQCFVHGYGLTDARHAFQWCEPRNFDELLVVLLHGHVHGPLHSANRHACEWRGRNHFHDFGAVFTVCYPGLRFMVCATSAISSWCCGTGVFTVCVCVLQFFTMSSRIRGMSSICSIVRFSTQSCGVLCTTSSTASRFCGSGKPRATCSCGAPRHLHG